LRIGISPIFLPGGSAISVRIEQLCVGEIPAVAIKNEPGHRRPMGKDRVGMNEFIGVSEDKTLAACVGVKCIIYIEETESVAGIDNVPEGESYHFPKGRKRDEVCRTGWTGQQQPIAASSIVGLSHGPTTEQLTDVG